MSQNGTELLRQYLAQLRVTMSQVLEMKNTK